MINMLIPWTEEEGKTRVQALFQDTFGDLPENFYKAPGRVNIIGEHVDYNAGICFPMALEHCTFIATKTRADRVVNICSAQEEKLCSFDLDNIGPKGSDKEVQGWISYVAGVFWAFIQEGYENIAGCDIALDSCVPYGAGLSSSAALECVIAVYLADQLGIDIYGADKDLKRADIARMCVRAENEVAGAPTGGMDQSASMRCESGKALALDCKTFTANLVPFKMAENDLELLVIDTKAEHKLVDGQYGKRRQTCMDAAKKLGVSALREISIDTLSDSLDKLDNNVEKQRTKHIVTEIHRTQEFIEILSNNTSYSEDIKQKLGERMFDSHQSLRCDYEVSCKELDLVVDTMKENGAWGSRMTGGGFGGCAIALIQRQDRDRLSQKVAEAFEKAGYTSPVIMTAVAGQGARKL
ncbi:galactokinase [Actinomyces sp. zg-332]|uniref:galactokinase n=1 Tax=Actinomyces sp. zg-332 TaxID=2708340 RepID=UPI001E454A25|nr:galactokinase [Actinomyces sp. zg-332]